MPSLVAIGLLTTHYSLLTTPYSAPPIAVTAALRNVVKQLDADIPVAEPATMADLLADSVAGFRVLAVSLTLFATVAVSLAAIGLYGVLAYYVTQRVREIGIRVALGADAMHVVTLILKRGISLVGAGIVIGIGGAFGVTRLIQQMLFGVAATDPATFATVSVFFAIVALAACLIPALRALRVDPVTALRAE